VRVENLTKLYGPKKAVDNISFEVEKGEIVGFLGPNGAGKTTTMRIITCYLSATAGSVSVAGHDCFSDSLAVKKEIGYLPENPPLYMEMSVRSYLDFVAQIKGIASNDRKAAVDSVLEKCWITDVEHKVIGHCSKGYRQRVGIAQALIHNPNLLVLDEPTNGLDPRQIIEVRELIKGLASDHTVILSTHILPEASATCGRVLIINEGKIIASDTPARLNRHIQGGDTLVVSVTGPAEEVQAKLSTVSGVQQVTLMPDSGNTHATFEVEAVEHAENVRMELVRAVVDNQWQLYELKNARMSLEDIFLKLTTTEEVAN